MRRSLPLSPERFPPRSLALVSAAVAIGIAAERAQFGWSDARHWVPDLLTGLILVACGAIALSRRAAGGSGALLAATGLTWFAGNFTSTGLAAIDWSSAHLLFLHRGPLVAVALTYPYGRPHGRIQRSAVAVAALAAVIAPVWRSEAATIALSLVFVSVAALSYGRAVGRERRARRYGLQATTFLGALLVAIAAVHLVAPLEAVKEEIVLAYEAGLCTLAVGLLAGLLRSPWERASVTDLVIEIGESRSASLRDALARALGDRTLQVGYRLPNSDAYVDASGRPLELPEPGSPRRIEKLERDGRQFAVLVHDAAVLDDPGLVDGIAAAARLTASNARLQAEVRAQMREVQSSRRRLLDAGDEERRRLEQRLNESAASRLASIAERLARARSLAGPATAAKIERAQEQLHRSRADLQQLANGLHPRELEEKGLAATIASLVQRSPLPVELEAPAARFTRAVEAAAYFVCSEALANIAKYALASHASVRVVARVTTLNIEVADDGAGGANPAGGTGLRGLADRVEALGGTFRIDSPLGGGTRLTAELPLDRSR